MHRTSYWKTTTMALAGAGATLAGLLAFLAAGVHGLAVAAAAAGLAFGLLASPLLAAGGPTRGDAGPGARSWGGPLGWGVCPPAPAPGGALNVPPPRRLRSPPAQRPPRITAMHAR